MAAPAVPLQEDGSGSDHEYLRGILCDLRIPVRQLLQFENVIPALWLHPKRAMTLPFIGSMNTVFVAAVAFGMFMILTGMVLHMINAARNHKLGELLFSQNSLAGFIFYGALARYTLVLLFSGHKAPAVSVMVVMFGIPLLAIFLKEPLERMVEEEGQCISGDRKGNVLCTGILRTLRCAFELLLQHNFLCPCRRICSQPCGYDGGCLMLGGATGEQHQLAGYCSRKHLRCLP